MRTHLLKENKIHLKKTHARQDDYANSLSWAKTKLSRTNKQNQVYHENRLVWHTIAIHYYSSKQTKKATIISANYTLNQNVTARFFISSFFQDKYYSNYYIYETFLRYSKQNKQPKQEQESGKSRRTNSVKGRRCRRNNYKTVKNKNKMKIINQTFGEDERETNFLCATFRRKTIQNKGEN